VYLDLVRIRLPLPGIVSILHRASGAVLFLFAIPLLLLAVQCSLGSPEQFASLKSALSHPLAKLAAIGFVWAYLHHFCAGIRYLLLDLHVGVSKESARASAKLVFALGAVATLLIGWRLW
jgi:succinate dehydrogenase / fumarate reductase cytochrome b subunit